MKAGTGAQSLQIRTGDQSKVNIFKKIHIAHDSLKQGTQGAEFIQTFRTIAVMDSETQLCSTV